MNDKPIDGQVGRNYGIDALRIVSMMMVVMLHVLGHGGILDSAAGITAGRIDSMLFWFLESMALCAVNCFALVSGYVGVCAKHKFSNLVMLWLRVLFYTVSITVLFKVLDPGSVGVKELVLAVFPVLTQRYWYFTSYVVLFLLIPVLNAALNSMSQKRMKVLLISLIMLFCAAYPFTATFLENPFDLNGGYSPWWLMVLYLIGGYVRKYGFCQRIKTVFLALLFFASSMFTWGERYAIKFVTEKTWDLSRYTDIFQSYISISVFLSGLFLLLIFQRIQFYESWIRIIAFLSPLAFSVYLIHDNEMIRERFITNKFIWITDLPVYQSIPLVFGLVFGIYMVCSAIDLVRHYLFKWLKLKVIIEGLENRIKNRWMIE